MSMLEHEIKSIVSSFKQLPYLFVGTGLSMRYSNAPSWNSLLYDTWCLLNQKDEQQYQRFIRKAAYDIRLDYSKANEEERKYYLNPRIASLLQQEFNAKCLSDSLFEKSIFNNKEQLDILENDYDYFKYYIAKQVKELDIDIEKNETIEIKALTRIQNKIAGVITTNYDFLLEKFFPDFGRLIGQDQLLVSNTSNIFEMYKIHGSCDYPNTIVITEEDYRDFKDRLNYLSAKLLTIFVEHPIIFIGYGIGDLNVRTILEGIAQGLTKEQLGVLKNNLIFINPILNDGDKEGIKTKEINFQEHQIIMTEITLKNFDVLYESFDMIKSSLPVKIIRKMQDMLCRFIASTDVSKNIMVGSVDNPNINGEELGIYIGDLMNVSNMGFDFYGINEILEDILFDNKKYLMNKNIIEKTFARIRSQAGKTYLPIHKYIKGLNLDYNDLPKDWYIIRSYESIELTTTEKSYTRNSKSYASIKDILNDYPDHRCKQFSHILRFRKEIETDELEEFLKFVFKEEEIYANHKSQVKKLIALYDFKKYGQK